MRVLGSLPESFHEPLVSVAYNGERFCSPYLDGTVDGSAWYRAEEYVNVPDDGCTLTFAVELWVNYDYSTNLATPKGLVYKGYDTGWTERNYAVTLQTTRQIKLSWTSGSSIPKVISSAALTDPSKWYHIVAVFDWTIDVFQIYIDGVLDTSVTNRVNAIPATGKLVIGKLSENASSDRFFDGAIDEVMISNRVLSSDEVSALFQFSYGLNQFLMPRSIFYDTQLYTKLNSGYTGYNFKDFQYADYSKDRVNSDAIQAVLTINATYNGLKQLVDLMLYNTSGSRTYDIVNIEDYLYLADLPDDAVKIVAYNPLVNTPSTIYIFSDGSINEPSLIEKLWRGIVDVITISLSYIYSGLVATWNFLLAIGQVLEQIGHWIWSAITNSMGEIAQEVKQAVQAAAQAFVQMVDWVVDLVQRTINP